MSSVIKRDGKTVAFNEVKIANAIRKGNRDVEDNERANDVTIDSICKEIATKFLNEDLDVQRISIN